MGRGGQDAAIGKRLSFRSRPTACRQYGSPRKREQISESFLKKKICSDTLVPLQTDERRGQGT